MNDQTGSSANTEPQLLSEEGGIKVRDFNPKAILRFTGRKCLTCGEEILDHWIRHSDDPDLRAEYWCSKNGNQFSEGLNETVWDVPEGLGK
jgi:hypothetical protein